MTPNSQVDASYWRQGLWLGLAWGVVEVGILGGVPRVPLGPALLEIAMSGVIWACLGGLLGRVLRRVTWLGTGTGAVVLVGLFFAFSVNLLIHPFLLAGVNLLSPVGLVYALVFTAIMLFPAGFIAARATGPRHVPPVLLILTALAMAVVFVVGRAYLVTWPPTLGRVWAAIGVALMSEILVLTAITRAQARTGTGRTLLGGMVAALLLVAMVGPVPALLAYRSRPEPGKATAPNDSPPVILISLDTLRPDHLSAFGYFRETSPNLDRFLAASRLFPRTYSTAPWTYPSHASAFTGLYPRAHGAHYSPGGKAGELPRPFDSRATTLAETFRDRGYITAAISSNRLAVSPELGLDRGFQEVRATRRIPDRPVPLNYVRSTARLLRTHWLWRFTRSHHDATEMTNRAVAWIEDHEKEPFFLFLNYLDPHAPYTPPARFLPGYENLSPRERLALQFRHAPKKDSSIVSYDGEIRYMDSELDRLFATLESTGLMDRAVIVVFSDHGEFFGELGLNGHGRDVHEAVLRVLLAVRSPGGAHAGTDSTLASLTDIPSLIEDSLTGRVPQTTWGDSPRVAGEKYLNQRDMRRAPRFQGSPRLVAVRWGDFKLIDHTTHSLFNVREDPLEKVDLARTHPDVAMRLREYLITWEEQVETPLVESLDVRNEKLREVLRGLGYMQ